MAQPIIVFIVDDDEDDRQFLMEVIAQINPRTIFKQFNNGQDALHALEAAEASLPDIIFLDLNMPRLNGRQCLQQLKENKRTSDIPVVIYTTGKKEDDMEEAQKSGSIHYIIKPTCRKDLKKEIEFVLAEILNGSVTSVTPQRG